MFKRIMNKMFHNRSFVGYCWWSLWCGFGLVLDFSTPSMFLYGASMGWAAYRWGESASNKKAIEIYEPVLEKAKKKLDASEKQMIETNRQIALLKEKLGEYENLS